MTRRYKMLHRIKALPWGILGISFCFGGFILGLSREQDTALNYQIQEGQDRERTDERVEEREDLRSFYGLFRGKSADIHEERLKIVRVLLESGANINTKTEEGYTPLHYAAMTRDEALVQEFIKAKADVNVATEDGYTPLHYAAVTKSFEIVCLLIEAGANVNAKAIDGHTPLHYAASEEFGNKEFNNKEGKLKP
ncbi:MAG: ankyrin repeat domain-containing protein [Puniceicoccales bacterium]|nr:ankyrin repeat domain-containing protein [Puniceicoccales bacterium]